MSVRARIFQENAEDLLPRLPADSFDSIVCDPPYGLEFMGKAWDKFRTGDGFRRSRNQADADRDNPFGRASRTSPEYVAGLAFQRWCKAWATEAFRVLKPGGYLVAFGGTRTYHRLACAIEDAGLEVRDSLHWVYGSGMPKGLNVSKAIDKAAGAQRKVIGEKISPDGKSYSARHGARSGRSGGIMNGEAIVAVPHMNELVTESETEDAARWEGWNVALKPAHEPIILARKPLSESTVAANVLRWGTGALNVDGCKVGTTREVPASLSTRPNDGRTYGKFKAGQPADLDPNVGRWPPNLLLTHSASCQPAGTRRVKSEGDYLAHMPEMTQAFTCAPDCPVAGLDAQSGIQKDGVAVQRNRRGQKPASVYGTYGTTTDDQGYGGQGGASRFFPAFTWSPEYDLPFFYCAKAPKKERPRIVTDDGRVIQHPTVKPLSLCRFLVRLVTQPGGTVGDFFTGTGPVVQAALDEGMRCVACDQDPDSVALSRVRLAPYAGVRFTVPEPAEQPVAEPEEAECG